MGGNISSFHDNQALVDNLKENCQISDEIERIMRLVDRGFYSTGHNSRIYSDTAWRHGLLHLSAPSIYCTVLRELHIQPGHSILNIGSGTGYLSTMFGLMLGTDGVNHGIEIFAKNLTFSKTQLTEFMATNDAVYERVFCIPHFMQGNIFDLVPPASTQASTNAVPVTHSPVPEPFPEDGLPMAFGVSVAVNVMAEPSPNQSADAGDESDSDDYHLVPMEERIECGGPMAIGPPPLLYTLSPMHPPSEEMRWPVYDRIYVGSAINSRAQLEAVLRLLKVGGILLAPVNDRFVRITRTEVDETKAEELLSVSFASLVPPSSESSPIEPPPPRCVQRLERLAIQTIRRELRKIIEARHNGLPSLGRLQKASTVLRDDEREQEKRAVDAVGYPDESSTIRRCDDDSEQGDNTPRPSREFGEGKEQVGPNENSCLNGDFPDPSDDSQASEGTSSERSNTKKREANDEPKEMAPPKKRCNDEMMQEDESTVPEVASTLPGVLNLVIQHQRLSHLHFDSSRVALLASTFSPRARMIHVRRTPVEHDESSSEGMDEEGSEEEEEEETEESRQSEDLVWIPPSYIYREEIYRILTEEIRAPEHVAQRVVRII